MSVHVLPQALIIASATIILALGVAHLFYTVASRKFHPRDTDLEARLKVISPVISRETTNVEGVGRLQREP
jgi:hypothetical protein